MAESPKPFLQVSKHTPLTKLILPKETKPDSQDVLL